MDFLISNVAWIGLIVSIIGLGFAVYTARWIGTQDSGNERMQQIAGYIQRGARAFLSREYRYIGGLVAAVTVVLLVLSAIPNSGMSPWTALAFVCGAGASALAGYIGMSVAVRSNVRTTAASMKSLNQGLRVAFASGSVMGPMVVALSLLGGIGFGIPAFVLLNSPETRR